MLTLPYQTSICAMYQAQLQPLANALARANIEFPLQPVVTPAGNTLRNAYFVSPRDEHEVVPSFTQFVNLGTDSQPKLVIDGRAYMRWDRRLDTYRLTAENDYSFQCSRLALTTLLMQGDQNLFRRLGDYPIKVFVRLITLRLAQQYNLPYEIQLNMAVIAAYYYYTQLSPERVMSVDERVQMAPFVARATLMPVQNVLEISDRLGPLTTANDLAIQLSTNAGSIRMGQLKFMDLYTMLAPSWVGVQARENVGVALEHIPTFIAMLYAALGERSYRSTVLTTRAQSVGRPADHNQFLEQVYRQIADQFN